MEDELVSLQISATYREKLRRLAQNSKRSMKNEFEWIIDDEIARRNGLLSAATETLEPSTTLSE